MLYCAANTCCERILIYLIKRHSCYQFQDALMMFKFITYTKRYLLIN